jgi:hypothetical protein
MFAVIDGIGETNEYVGYSGMGNFQQTGGTNNLGQALYLGFSTNSSGTYSLQGGNITLRASNKMIHVGSYGRF